MANQSKHTVELTVYEMWEHQAVVMGEYVKIIVDCRENFGNPKPLARLIAAAPDMLLALKNCRDEIEIMVRDLKRFSAIQVKSITIEAADEAIAKAERGGRTRDT